MNSKMEGLTLPEFLSARIAEAEAAARTALERAQGSLWVVTGTDNPVGVDYDPAHILADCEAKRRIVEDYIALVSEPDDKRPEFYRGMVTNLYDVMQYLAAIYKDRPDYRDEWRP